jgi:UDP-N-acetylglucosamine 2-epimerase (non-hydrolysing)/GDP/UDP-N,N'-diacetylbacillosamine 2-epimerase (hydrolysing)
LYFKNGAFNVPFVVKVLHATSGNGPTIYDTSGNSYPTVNIGSRQEGRLRGQNVIDVDYIAEDIYSAISKCLFDDEFRRECEKGVNPYWKGGAGIKIAKYLSTLQIDGRLIRKRMTLKGKLIESFRGDL